MTTTRAVHPRLPPGRSRAGGWWAKAWLRAVEEAAYAEAELVRGRALARLGRVGGIAVDAGGFVAAVEDGDELWTVAGTVPPLGDDDAGALVETVAAVAGRVAALLDGQLPFDLVEHAEEAGVELLPYGGELGTTCTCDAWVDPCPHALAVLVQLATLVDRDPLVLFHLRGLPREELLSRLHSLGGVRPSGPAGSEEEAVDLDVAEEAARRAARMLDDT